MSQSFFKSLSTGLAQKLALIPFPVLIVICAFMLLAPISPEPHLIQKLNWVASGQVFKAIDVFDVFWHLLPSVVLLLKIALNRKS